MYTIFRVKSFYFILLVTWIYIFFCVYVPWSWNWREELARTERKIWNFWNRSIGLLYFHIGNHIRISLITLEFLNQGYLNNSLIYALQLSDEECDLILFLKWPAKIRGYLKNQHQSKTGNRKFMKLQKYLYLWYVLDRCHDNLYCAETHMQ